jgi:hypothetical protein
MKRGSMKFIYLTLTAIILFPLTAKADLTNADITEYNKNYADVFETCNPDKISNFIETHYADDYVMTLQAPSGETRRGNKEQIKQIALQGVQIMQNINGPEADCRPDMTVDKMQLEGDTGIMQTTQKEEITMPQNGKMVGVRANTTCQHRVVDQNGTFTILASQCRLYQE